MYVCMHIHMYSPFSVNVEKQTYFAVDYSVFFSRFIALVFMVTKRHPNSESNPLLKMTASWVDFSAWKTMVLII